MGAYSPPIRTEASDSSYQSHHFSTLPHYASYSTLAILKQIRGVSIPTHFSRFHKSPYFSGSFHGEI